jgi:ABC-2 type transport system permease protein
MPERYSQIKAMFAITRASLTAVFRSPSAVIFSLAFPLIFILVFGFLGGTGGIAVKVAFDPASDTTSPVYRAIRTIAGIKVIEHYQAFVNDDLEKGRITSIIRIIRNANDSFPAYRVHLKSSVAVNPQHLQVLRSILESAITGMNRQHFPNLPTYATISDQVETVQGRVYRTIDFILPGQLGFSLLSAGVFGVAFIFFNLRQTLVLKRFFATPIQRSYILFGEGLSRVIFQLITAVVILLVGHFAFHFTLVHGWATFVELLFLSFVGLIVFMGFGFVVSGVAKNESSIPPFANLFTLPQFLLAGTFFPIDNFPGWLQPVCNVLPLTHLNDAMRNVAFEGARIGDCGKQLAVLGIWAVVAYAIAVKVFKWE